MSVVPVLNLRFTPMQLSTTRQIFNKSGLAYKLSVYILTSTIVILLLILSYNYIISRKLLLDEVKENVKYLTQSTVNKIMGIALLAQNVPENLSGILENSTFSEEELNDFLHMIVKNNNEVFGSCIAFEPYAFFRDSMYYAPYYFRSGDSIKYKNLADKDYNYYNKHWYQLPKSLNSPVWTEPYFDEGGGDFIMTTYSVPFYRPEGKSRILRGIVTADVSLEWLKNLMSSLKIYQSGYAFLISGEGTFITHPVDSLILKETIFSIAKKYNNPDLFKIGEEMIGGKSNFVPYKSLVLQRKCWLYYAPLSNGKWSMGVIIPENELFADMYKLFRRLLFMGFAGMFVLLVVILIISAKITIPLRKLTAITSEIGAGNLNARIPDLKQKDEIGLLSSSFKLMQNRLKDYIQNLQETTAAKEKIESELKIAHDIQQGIIPKIFPAFPERSDVDIYAILEPAKQVGGDLYDFFFIEDNVFCFGLGDVSGKGVPASLLMAITTTLLRAKATAGLKVNEIVKKINEELSSGNENMMFVTMFLGIIDLDTGILEYCNAGHNYPYVLRSNDETEQLAQTHGIPLGIDVNAKYETGKTMLHKNESIVLYTDGVTEAIDKDGNFFEEEKLDELIKTQCLNKGAREVTTIILQSALNFSKDVEQADDITILVLKVKGNNVRTDYKGISISNDIADLKKIHSFIANLDKEWDLGKELTFDINLVIEEVIANLIHHGYDDNEVHEIKLELYLKEEGIKIQIIDDAREFNLLETPEPSHLSHDAEERAIGGLGIHFIKSLTDHIEYVSDNELNKLILFIKR